MQTIVTHTHTLTVVRRVQQINIDSHSKIPQDGGRGVGWVFNNHLVQVQALRTFDRSLTAARWKCLENFLGRTHQYDFPPLNRFMEKPLRPEKVTSAWIDRHRTFWLRLYIIMAVTMHTKAKQSRYVTINPIGDRPLVNEHEWSGSDQSTCLQHSSHLLHLSDRRERESPYGRTRARHSTWSKSMELICWEIQQRKPLFLSYASPVAHSHCDHSLNHPCGCERVMC